MQCLNLFLLLQDELPCRLTCILPALSLALHPFTHAHLDTAVHTFSHSHTCPILKQPGLHSSHWLAYRLKNLRAVPSLSSRDKKAVGLWFVASTMPALLEQSGRTIPEGADWFLCHWLKEPGGYCPRPFPGCAEAWEPCAQQRILAISQMIGS